MEVHSYGNSGERVDIAKVLTMSGYGINEFGNVMKMIRSLAVSVEYGSRAMT